MPLPEVVTRNIEFQWQRGTAVRLAQLDPILRGGEPCYETDTGWFKIGNGFTPWSLLPYYMDEAGTRALVEELLAELGGGEFDPRVGDLTELNTDEKGNLVGAINEVNTAPTPFTLLYDNAKAG